MYYKISTILFVIDILTFTSIKKWILWDVPKKAEANIPVYNNNYEYLYSAFLWSNSKHRGADNTIVCGLKHAKHITMHVVPR